MSEVQVAPAFDALLDTATDKDMWHIVCCREINASVCGEVVTELRLCSVDELVDCAQCELLWGTRVCGVYGVCHAP